MEAICKADFERRVKEYKAAMGALEQAKKEKKSTSGIIVPEVGFNDIYGVWFFGRLKEIILNIGTERFGVDFGKQMHVFVDVDPKKNNDGIHEITVYGHPYDNMLCHSHLFHHIKLLLFRSIYSTSRNCSTLGLIKQKSCQLSHIFS